MGSRFFIDRMTKLQDEQGMVFVSTLIISAILFSLGTAYMHMTRSETRTISNEVQKMQAFHYAEAGIEHAIGEINYGMDVTGGGEVGGISSWDMDSDGDSDYNVSYNSTTGLMLSTGTEGGISKTIEAKINTNGFPAAIIAGNGMYVTSTGTVNGNIWAGDINEFSIQNLNVIGSATNSGMNVALEIPIPNFTTYFSQADHFSSGYNAEYTTNCFNGTDTWTIDDGNCALPAPISNGIYYYNSHVEIKGFDVTINGTLVAMGNIKIMLDANASLTVNPFLPGYPAIIAGNNLDSFAPNSTVTLNGLVYADKWVYLNDFYSLTINGALVLRSTNDSGLEVQVPVLNVTYNPDMNNPYFALEGPGTPPPVVVSWKGHGS